MARLSFSFIAVSLTLAACDDDSSSSVHPLCSTYFEEGAEGRIFYSDPISCGSYTGGDDDEALQCFLQGAGGPGPTSLEVDLVEPGNESRSRGRVLHVEGDLALDQRTGFDAGTTEWGEVRVLEAPDLAECADLADASATWDCIESAFDGATSVDSCYEAGGFAFPE